MTSEDVPEVYVVTGMSGAGRSTVAKVMEDLGWYVIDNLPTALLPQLVEMADAAAESGRGVPERKVGIVLDIRAQGFDDLDEAIERLRAKGWSIRLLFLDATDEALVRRFESVRRPHPLQQGGRLLDGIQAERERLSDLRSVSDLVIDTSGLNVHQLSRKIHPIISADVEHSVRLAVMSFGFKYGVPLDADFVFDMRWLPNPFWVPELRPFTGREEAVSGYVLGQEGAEEFLDAVVRLFEPVLAGYLRENRKYVTVAVGCTGGKHRSVAVAEALSRRLSSETVETFVVHRDLGQE
ncbi:RNase adapter RapZ [Janibacter sp. YIM B02568]|uniref:RNase adapter RapZ n=1 Tax=Janibacter endophyticus TaxID=2806261 RepID=UPI001950FB78|nr:RNase adapter RapZ [Janibacter endophyticus]MBM6546468.1 RNase adapter RapZ [Janibacter endophyticus]